MSLLLAFPTTNLITSFAPFSDQIMTKLITLLLSTSVSWPNYLFLINLLYLLIHSFA